MLKRKFAENVGKPPLNDTNDSRTRTTPHLPAERKFCSLDTSRASIDTCIDWHVTSSDHLSQTLSLEREEERDSRDDVVTLSSRSDQYQISPHNIRA